MDEPERIGWLEQGEEPQLHDIGRRIHQGAVLHHWHLQGEPEQIEIDEVQQLSVEIGRGRPEQCAAEE